MTTLTSVTKMNRAACCDAAFDIAQNNVAGVTWADARQWRMPKPTEIASYPYLVVTRPRFARAIIAGKPQGLELYRHNNQTESAWNMEVYGIYAYDTTSDLTFSTAEDTEDALVQTFTQYVDLNATCEICNIVSPETTRLMFQDGAQFWAAHLTLRFYLVIGHDL